MRNICILLAATFAFLCVRPLWSQQVLTNTDIVDMVRAKLSDPVIIAEIQKSKCNFATSPKDLIGLKKVGLGDAILEAMTEAGRSVPRVQAPAQKEESKPMVLQKIRKVYIYCKEGWWHRKADKDLRKSCIGVVTDPRKADAILAYVPYHSWFDDADPALDTECNIISYGNESTVTCNGPEKSAPTDHFSHWVFVNPRTGKRIGNWSVKSWIGFKGKVEKAVGCR